MGRLSLAIGRHKEGGGGNGSGSSDARIKPRHLRTSIRGLLGIPGSERASVDLGEMGDIADERSDVLRRSPGASKLTKEDHSCSTATTAVNTGDLSTAAAMSHNSSNAAASMSASSHIPGNADDPRQPSAASEAETQPSSASATIAPPKLAPDAHSNNTKVTSDDAVSAQATRVPTQRQEAQQLPTDIGAPMHAHAEAAPASRSQHPADPATADQPDTPERFSISAARDAAAASQSQLGKDEDKHGWRRRGSLISSRLALPLRKDGAGSAGSNRTLIRKESTPLFGSSKHHPFWRAGGLHRSSFNAQEERPLPPLPLPHQQPHVEAAAREERTHRSSSVPFITPILSTKDSNNSLLSSDNAGVSWGLASASRKPVASPYLRAVSSGLARATGGASSGAGAAVRLSHDHRAKSTASSRHMQDRLPGSTLSPGFDGVGMHGPPLCKRTLSSTTIPSLDLNVPGSPKALSGGVDLSEFGVATGRSAAGSAETRSNLSLPPSPVSTGTPARSIASASACATFEPVREAAVEDEDSSGAASNKRQSPSQPPSDTAANENSGEDKAAQSPDGLVPLAHGSNSSGGNSGSTDAVHETHHMEVQHDPRTGRKMINQYMIIRELGRGTHGKVKLAFDTITGEYYAIKVIDKETQDRRLRPNASSYNARRAREAAAAAAAVHGSGHRRSRGYMRIDFDKMEKVKREIAILKKCRHPNVVRLREVIDDAHARRIYLVIEYMDQGEIVWRDSNRLPAMSHGEARSVFRDLVLGVEYLHYVGILHRDLKPQNLLRNKAGTVKISDFGVSFLSRRMSKTHTKAGECAGKNVPANALASAAPPAQSPSHPHPLPPSPLRPAGMRPAKQSSSLHRYASQPMMSTSSSRVAAGPVLHRKASVLSSSSKNLLTSASTTTRDSDRSTSAGTGGPEGLRLGSSGALKPSSSRSYIPISQLQKLCMESQLLSDAAGGQSKHGSQRPFSQSIQWPATMGMTNEFGHRKASLPLPLRPADIHQRQSSAGSELSEVCKLPVEIHSADTNVYDPFDSSDSAEFFSSDESNSDSDYGGHCPRRGHIGDADDSSDDDDNNSEDGIVFGAGVAVAAARQEGGSTGNEAALAADRPSGAEASSRHQRKGTLGDISFAYDEKDEDRELAKTAGTPAFFAPELCCTTEELANVLREERLRRRTDLRNAALRHRHSTDPVAAAALLHATAAGQSSAEHAHGGHGKGTGGSNRPTSLYVESSAGGDTQRTPRIIKRHSMLTSLLTRPFSARSRSSANNSSGSNRSSTNEGQLADAHQALDGLRIADAAAEPGSPAGSVPDDASASEISAHLEETELPSNVITPAIDIWAMGVTLYCLIYGRVPFQASTEFELFNVIPRQQIEFPEYLEAADEEGEDESCGFDGLLFNPSRNQADSDGAGGGSTLRESSRRRVDLPPLDPELCDLLRRLLDKDFRTRITIEEIKQHPWVVCDLDRPSSWAKETDPTHRPSLVITSQEVEQAMVPKVHQGRGFRASVRRRISMLSPLGASRRNRDSQQRQGGNSNAHISAKTKSSLDWLKIW
ncbi:hypothetical protein GGH99_000579 [Coemansia sp. RSA 1285]|nr:hypothetical protein GGH99_000579 [Coemansia sp. RSA 1285]